MDSVAVRRYLEGTGAERCDPCGNDSGLYQQGREGTEKPREGHADANYREVEGTTDLQREFNNYLNSFRSIVCYAAQIYGFYHEISQLTDNMGDFTKQLSRHSTGALAVALSTRRNQIYREMILNSVEIVNDIRTACLSDNKMTERERMEIVFGIRPKLRSMNRTLQRLTKAVKYTTMGDIWREIDEGARPVADKYDIVKAAQRRWRQIGRNVRP